MQYYQNYKLKNSFNLPCVVNNIWFPETYQELRYIFTKVKEAIIIADCTNIICKPVVNKVICLTKMPKEINLINYQNYSILCNANVKSNVFIQYLISHNIGGYENLYGLPGKLGSAIYGNSGSGDTCISDYLNFILTTDRYGKEYCFNKKDLKFKRRYSVLQNMNHVITDICFLFPKKEINQEKLQKAKEHRSTIPGFSVGGIFSNWHVLKPYKEQLIGLRVGDAEVSESINIIINKGNATYKNVMTLIDKIKHIVKIPLILEAQII